MARAAAFLITAIGLCGALVGCSLFDGDFGQSSGEAVSVPATVDADGPGVDPDTGAPLDPPPPPAPLDCAQLDGSGVTASAEEGLEGGFVVRLTLAAGHWGGVQVEELVGATVDHIDVPGLSGPPTVAISMSWDESGGEFATFDLEATVLGVLGEVCELSRTFTIRKDPTLTIE